MIIRSDTSDKEEEEEEQENKKNVKKNAWVYVVHLVNVEQSQVVSDHLIKAMSLLTGCYSLHPPSPFVMVTQPHCRILSPDKTDWRLISATLCGWRRCFLADQL